MPIESLLKIEKMITGRVKEIYGLSRHDLLVITCCRSMEETVYSLEKEHELDRGLTVKRLKILESKGFLIRDQLGKRRIIKLTERAQEVIRFVEGIKVI